ncbi:biliverdin-producing heme oxygenase [Bordetella sp. H567]|uniref:biliverdin-producing heme oxygenase n=1 Tax=Bordetella sp. H567 TaxID=1697043 RepID=UPI001F310ED7|nr:biliverdin-producing heme oxygenase [Bordetella sp. H567]
MDVHATLRLATQARHERLDSSLRIGSAQADYADYLAYIAALRGWLEPVEAALWARDWPAALRPDVRRCKAARIDQDFAAARALGLPVPPVPVCDKLPDVGRARAYALGVMYVIEGSQLGGRMMAKRLEQAWPDRSFHYMAGYGPELGTLWKGYMAFLADELHGEEDLAQAVAGACDAFDTLTDWLRCQGE